MAQRAAVTVRATPAGRAGTATPGHHENDHGHRASSGDAGQMKRELPPPRESRERVKIWRPYRDRPEVTVCGLNDGQSRVDAATIIARISRTYAIAKSRMVCRRARNRSSDTARTPRSAFVVTLTITDPPQKVGERRRRRMFARRTIVANTGGPSRSPRSMIGV